jgi:hypothetical protein
VPGGSRNSKTSSRRASQSWSGQYPSAVAPSTADRASRTGRPTAAESRGSTSARSVVSSSPAGRVIRTGGSDRASWGGAAYEARKSNKFGQRRGSLALTTLSVSDVLSVHSFGRGEEVRRGEAVAELLGGDLGILALDLEEFTNHLECV